MAQRLVVFLMVGGVAGFGAVFLQLPGIVLALVVLAVVAGTGRQRSDLVRVGGYLMGVGVVGWSLVGPAVKGSGGFLFLSGWVLVTGYAAVAVAGSLLVAGIALVELPPPGPGPLTYFLLGAGAFLALYLPQPILPLLDRGFHTNPAVTGLTMTTGLLGFALAGLLPEGDPGRTLRRAMWLIVVSSAAAALSPHFLVLLLGRAGQGIGVGLLVAGGLADIARNHPAARGGRLTGSLIGGTAIGGLLSRLTGYSALWLGWRAAFALGGVLALGLLSFVLNRLAGTPAETGGSAVASPREGGAAPVGLIVAGLGILFVNVAVFDLLPYRLAAAPFNLPPALADLVYLTFAAALLSAGLAGRAIDRFGARAVVLATVGLGIGCLLVGLIPTLPAVVVMATGSVSAALALHTSHSGAAAARGRVAVGRYLAAYYVGGALAAPLIAAAYQAWGWPGAVLPLCAAWAGVGLLALFSPASRWRRETGPGAPPREQLPAAP